MKKILLILLASILLAHCSKSEQMDFTDSSRSSVSAQDESRPLNDEWMHFHSASLGFSINYPKMVFDESGKKMIPFRIQSSSSGAAVIRDSQELKQYWKITIVKIKNINDLQKFIQRNFGRSCGIELMDSNSEFVKYVNITRTDHLDLANTACPVNSAFFIQYNIKKSLLAYWDMGQEYQFKRNGGKDEENYDNEMANSFKFDD